MAMLVRATSPRLTGISAGAGISLASFRPFWVVAARWNSSRAPLAPHNRRRSSVRVRLSELLADPVVNRTRGRARLVGMRLGKHKSLACKSLAQPLKGHQLVVDHFETPNVHLSIWTVVFAVGPAQRRHHHSGGSLV